MSRARDLANQADGTISGALTTDGLTVDTNTLAVDASNNRVGIGTSTPGEQLELLAGSERLMIGANNPSTFSRVAARNSGDSGYRGLKIDGSDLLLNTESGSGNIIMSTGSDKVGIGTATPAKKLDISGDSGDVVQAKVTYAGADGNRAGFILANTHTGGREYGIYAGNDSTGGGLGNSFGISDNTAGTAYRLIIDSSGKVGIGTTSPADKLEIQGSGSDGIRLSVSGQSYYHKIRSNGDGLLLSADDSDAGGAGADIRFHVGNDEKMRLNDDGKLGIGETSPQATLHLDTETSGLPRIRFDHQNASADVFEIGSGVDGQTNAGFSIKDVDANATRLAIDDNGIFMLNKLYSNGALTGFEHRGTGQTWITMNQATNEGVLYINQTTGGGNANADSGLVIQGHGTNAASGQSTLLRVEGQNPTHGTKDAFTVTNNGRVGIGTYKPTTNLNIIAGNGGGLLMSTYFNGTVTSGVSLGELGFKGYADGNTTAGADAKIVGKSDGNHTGTSAPARLDFFTKDDSIGPGSAPNLRFRIDRHGAANVRFGVNNWSNFVQGNDGSGTHYRLFGAGSSTTNYNLMRYRRHYWGSGSVHITLFQTYYSTTSQGEYWLAGYGRSDGSYSPNYNLVYRDIYNGPGSGRLSINLPGGAPGNSDAEIVDVSISIPAYVYYMVKIEVSHSTFYPTTTTMPGINSYALFS